MDNPLRIGQWRQIDQQVPTTRSQRRSGQHAGADARIQVQGLMGQYLQRCRRFHREWYRRLFADIHDRYGGTVEEVQLFGPSQLHRKRLHGRTAQTDHHANAPIEAVPFVHMAFTARCLRAYSTLFGSDSPSSRRACPRYFLSAHRLYYETRKSQQHPSRGTTPILVESRNLTVLLVRPPDQSPLLRLTHSFLIPDTERASIYGQRGISRYDRFRYADSIRQGTIGRPLLLSNQSLGLGRTLENAPGFVLTASGAIQGRIGPGSGTTQASRLRGSDYVLGLRLLDS